MCYKSPGPRCSPDMKVALDKAKASGDQAAIDAAHFAYDATPDGITALQKEAVDLHAEGKVDEAEEVADRAKAAKARRAAQLAAYKEAYPEEFKKPVKASAEPIPTPEPEPEVEAEAEPTKPAQPAPVAPQIPASLMAPSAPAPSGPVLPARLSSTGRARTADGAHVDGDDNTPTPVEAPARTEEPVLPAHLSSTGQARTAQRDPNAPALPPITPVAPREEEPVSRVAADPVKREAQPPPVKSQQQTQPRKFSARVAAFVKPATDRVKARVDQFQAREGDHPDRYVNHANPKVRAAAASNLRLSPTTLAHLATDKNADVRAAVARNPRTGINTVVTVLANDRNRRVREALAANYNTPPELLKELAVNASPQTQIDLAGNPSTPRHLLDGYFHPAAKFSNAKQVPKHYPKGYADAINERLAQNHNTNPDILRDLVKNGSSNARKDAKFTLRELGLPAR